MSVVRRVICFSSLAEVLHDAEEICVKEILTTGAWSVGQILDHLAEGVDCFFDGFDFRAPWFARVLIAPFVRNNMLSRPMRVGFRLPEAAGRLGRPIDLSIEDGLVRLRAAIARLDADLPLCPHPLLGRLTREEVVALTLRHCELHLSFIVLRAE